MDIARTEEEQLEALKKWWSENGWSIVAGIVIGLGAIFGWRSWQAYQLGLAEQASNLYTGMIADIRQQNNDEARTLANQLLDEYSGTTYATYAALMLARLEMDEEKPEAALSHLQWVMDKAKQDELKHLARLRMARVLLATGKQDEALKLLDVRNPGKFLADYEEIKGDIYMQLNEPDKARTAYQLALAGSQGVDENNPVLQMKIDAAGHITP